MTAPPKISVVMSVYNAENDLQKSVESILNQSFVDFEFIIINDGSTDGTKDILDSYAQQDSRIQIINQTNTGLTKALNNGVKQARGTYIARQDADDLSYPDRFAQQVAVMDGDPAIVLCGSNCDDLYAGGGVGQWGFYSPDELQKIVSLKTPFAHSTVMMRAETCHALGGYDETFKTAQDFELWIRMAQRGKLAMIQTPLIQRCIVSDSISQKHRWRQFYDASRARWKHAHGLAFVKAIYYGMRSLIIGLLPARWVIFLKGQR